MPKHMFIEGDYILTIDPLMVDKVAIFKDTYYFGLSDGSAHIVDKKYTSTIAKLLELVKPNFEVVDFGNTEENEITYKFLSGCVSGKFYLAFADFQSYDSAWNLLEKEFTKRHNAKISHHSDLAFSVSFPVFYDNFKDNKKVTVDLLGNPVNAVEGY